MNHQCAIEVGAGGQGGADGGAAGNGGSGGASCTDRETEYAAALRAAESCTVGASGQCQQRVGQFLTPYECNTGCSDLFVNDASTLDPIAFIEMGTVGLSSPRLPSHSLRAAAK